MCIKVIKSIYLYVCTPKTWVKGCQGVSVLLKTLQQGSLSFTFKAGTSWANPLTHYTLTLLLPKAQSRTIPEKLPLIHTICKHTLSSCGTELISAILLRLFLSAPSLPLSLVILYQHPVRLRC